MELNTSNPAIYASLVNHNVGAIRFFAGRALAKGLLYSRRYALVESFLAQLKTLSGLAPNCELSVAAFARALAKSPLLDGVERVFDHALAGAVGRSFRLAEIDVRISAEELGEPWTRPEGRQ